MSNPEATDFTKLYSSEDLFSFFEKEESCEEQIGIEVELAIVTPDTGISVPYGQINSLLRSMVEDQPSQWEPIFEGENIIQIKGADGTSISLENGGAIEYSSRPEKNLSNLIDKMNEEVSKLAARVENYGLALIAVSNMPFNKPEDTSWVPKFRGEIFRNHFASLGDAGSCGWRVMAQTLSTQVTFDYVSEELDFIHFESGKGSKIRKALFGFS